MAGPTLQSVELREYVTSTQKLRVDREAGVIYGVKVLGLSSANGRTYSPQATRAAIRLYEGRPVNVNHLPGANQTRSAYDRFGQLRNITADAAGELYGDLHYLKSHAMAGPVTEAAERMPEVFGLSHDAVGQERRRGRDKPIVESIEKVHAVDVVADPATTKGLHESRGRTMSDQGNNTAKTVRQLLAETIWRPKAKQWLLEMDAATMDTPSDQVANATSIVEPPAHGEELMQEVIDLVQGGLDSADTKVLNSDYLDALQQILDIAKPFVGGGDGEGEAEGEGEGEGGKKEGKKVQPTAAGDTTLREEINVRDLIEEAGLTFPKPEARKAFIKALVPLTEAERKALIEERKQLGTPPAADTSRPRSAGTHFQEGQGGAGAAPKFKDNKERVAFLRGRKV